MYYAAIIAIGLMTLALFSFSTAVFASCTSRRDLGSEAVLVFVLSCIALIVETFLVGLAQLGSSIITYFTNI